MYIILLCIREKWMNTLATSCLFVQHSPNSQHDIKKYIIRIFNKTAHDCILIHIKKDMQNYSIILIVNYIK